jgi:myosin heavy subunit
MDRLDGPSAGESGNAAAAAGEATTSKPFPASTSSPLGHGSEGKPATTGHLSSSKSPAVALPSISTKSAYSLDDANEELSQLIIRGKITSDDVPCLKAILKEHVSLKEKVEKLKSLLGRSAKAQREAKVDAEASQKRLTQAMREIERLHQKLEVLQTRPSHLDLLMDFETNFDKALLSVGQQQQQVGGQETSASTADHGGAKTSSSLDAHRNHYHDNLDSMLMQELGEAKSRIEKLEALNSAMMSRSTQLEHTTKTLQKERDEARNANSRLQMELRMAQLEAEQAQRAMMDKVASLEEMQMEIDCMTKASLKANVRAAKGEEAANSLKTEKQYIQQLESQVQALKEWAMASSEAKQLMQERCRILETKLKQQQGLIKGNSDDHEGNANEKVLFTKKGSKVVGAGDTSHVILSLGEHAMTVDARFVVLRWKFDSSPPDLTIDFNIMKGKCETSSEQARADYLIKDRVITGGAGGETEGAFNTDASCTILWSNVKSWIRPRTVKYSLEVISLK